jgi:RNA polymerase sigma-70 factor (ECF subfamily)
MTLEEILKNIASGKMQNQALQLLYKLKAAEFKRYFSYKGVHPDALEDVLQEAFVKIFKYAGSYHGQGGFSDFSAAAWLNEIRFTCMQDHFEKQNRRRSESTSYDEAEHQQDLEITRSADAADSNATQVVNECITEGLEDFAAEYPDRYDVLMAQLDGEDITSIGKRIGRTVAATKEYLSQCRKKLSPFIEHCKHLLPA